MAGVMTLMYKNNGGQWSSSNTPTFWFAMYLICQTIATIYSYVWDIYMDWGLCRYWEFPHRNQVEVEIDNPIIKEWNKKDEVEVEAKADSKLKFGLRQHIAFSCWFYYWAIVSDLLLRLTWCITVPLNPIDHPWVRSVKYATVIALLELFRRWQWSLLRIENE